MQLNILRPARGSKHRRKILGHGEGSGHGGSATRGTKGQKSRSGYRKRPGFEGGQMPLLRRIPKRGFSNRRFQREHSVVNISQLEKKFDSGMELTPDILYENKLIKKKDLPVKILADGDLTKKFIVKAHVFSKNAVKKINSAGGSIKQI